MLSIPFFNFYLFYLICICSIESAGFFWIHQILFDLSDSLGFIRFFWIYQILQSEIRIKNSLKKIPSPPEGKIACASFQEEVQSRYLSGLRRQKQRIPCFARYPYENHGYRASRVIRC